LPRNKETAFLWKEIYQRFLEVLNKPAPKARLVEPTRTILSTRITPEQARLSGKPGQVLLIDYEWQTSRWWLDIIKSVNWESRDLITSQSHRSHEYDCSRWVRIPIDRHRFSRPLGRTWQALNHGDRIVEWLLWNYRDHHQIGLGAMQIPGWFLTHGWHHFAHKQIAAGIQISIVYDDFAEHSLIQHPKWETF
jgi:hypothetical protein